MDTLTKERNEEVESENQRMIEEMVRDFADVEISPNIKKWDESQHFPKEL
ncbi:MAG: acyl-CoA dehydrogenase family protein, partial [Imperialibacter sp.]